MAADEREIRIRIIGESAGAEGYKEHARGIEDVGKSAKKTNEELQTSSLRTLEFLGSLHALRSGVVMLGRGIMFFTGENQALEQAIRTVAAAINLVVGAMQIYKGVSALVAAVDWGRAAAGIAANLWLAPVVAAVIAGALVTLYGLQAHWFAAGGSGVVREPTLFVAGEHGAEAYSFVPIAGATGFGGGSGGMSIGTVNYYIVADNPERVGEQLALHLRQLAGAGR